MECAQEACGYRQISSYYVYKDGPLFPFRDLMKYFGAEGILMTLTPKTIPKP